MWFNPIKRAKNYQLLTYETLLITTLLRFNRKSY